jgi:predicted lipoprotein with Yx(FWY)xxD motif
MKRTRNLLVGGALVVALAAVAVVAMASGSASTVAKGHALGKTVLVNRAGLTLYSLSAETKGRFICTGACTSLWHPLVITGGHKPTGSSSLGTIRRPDGRTQVTYKGKPLYAFANDQKRGQAKGEGFKDVGTWHAAVVGSAAKAPASMPAPTNTTPGYSY